jgi:hypothetical protein
LKSKLNNQIKVEFQDSFEQERNNVIKQNQELYLQVEMQVQQYEQIQQMMQ